MSKTIGFYKKNGKTRPLTSKGSGSSGAKRTNKGKSSLTKSKYNHNILRDPIIELTKRNEKKWFGKEIPIEEKWIKVKEKSLLTLLQS